MAALVPGPVRSTGGMQVHLLGPRNLLQEIVALHCLRVVKPAISDM